MKINIIKYLVVVILAAAIALPAIVSAQVPAAEGQGSSGATANTGAPATAGQNTGGATAESSTPAASGQNTGGATVNTAPIAVGQNTGGATVNGVPATSGQNTGGATSGAPATAGQNTGGANSGSVPTTAGQNTGGATPGSTGNGSGPVGPSNPNTSVSSGGGSVSSGGGSVTTLPPLTNVGQCLYMTTYLKFGQNNPSGEVVKLQNFLKSEGINVGVTGTFDQMTLNAVNAFQTKYLSEIMLPWGATTPSGYVYITTTKKINEIFCKKNFTLTPAQLAEIEAYRTNVRTNTPSTTVGGEIGIGNPTPSTSINPATGEVSTSTDTQVAAVAKTPIFSKIWNFIKRIFGR